MLRRPSAWPATLPDEHCSRPAYGAEKNFTSAVWINPAGRGSAEMKFFSAPAGP